jgi:hypothetical protein
MTGTQDICGCDVDGKLMTIIHGDTIVRAVFNVSTCKLTFHFEVESSVPAYPLRSIVLLPDVCSTFPVSLKRKFIASYLPIPIADLRINQWSKLDQWLVRNIAIAKCMTDILKALAHALSTSYIALYSFFDYGLPPRTMDVSMHFASLMDDKRSIMVMNDNTIMVPINEINTDNDPVLPVDNVMIALEEELSANNDLENIIDDF